MLSVHGTYDGKVVRVKSPIKVNAPTKVIVTFIDEIESDISEKNIQLLAQKGGAFDFLDNVEEDIYSDSNLKVKY